MLGTGQAIGDIGSELSRWRGEQPGTEAASAAACDLLNTAERRLSPGAADDTDAGTWHDFLYSTGVPDFLECLPDHASRERWADLTFRAIERSNYSLLTMLQQRVAAHPERILFCEAREANQASTYAQVAWYTRTLAGLFLQSVPNEPRVAIFCDNSSDSACADLACLLYGILVSPLNVHFDTETLVWIFQRLAINVVVTDSEERIARLSEVRSIL
ncbi:MAG: AMP-binding protein, partial [Candidatus Korobacteraceae bacterium]